MSSGRLTPENDRAIHGRIGQIFFILVLAICALATNHACAAGSNVSVTDFQHTTWTAKDGVLGDTWSIAQTTDGWLWFGGPNGLTQFDGFSFIKVELVGRNSKISNGISALYASPKGELFIGHQYSGVSVLMGGSVTNFDTEQTRVAGAVNMFSQDLDGVTWATTTNGLMRFDGREWHFIGSDWSYPGGRASGVFAGQDGTVWVALKNSVLRLNRNHHHFEDTALRVNGLADFFLSVDGRLWYVDSTGVHMIPGQGKTSPRNPFANSRASLVGLFDRKGDFWSWYLPIEVLPAPAVRNITQLGDIKTVLEDRDGNIWLGDQSAVVHRLRRAPIVKVSNLPTALSKEAPWASLATDKQGTLWMTATNGGRGYPVDGLWKLDQSGKVPPQHIQADEIKSATVIGVTRKGELWVGGRQGLWKYKDGRFLRVIQLPDEVKEETIGGFSPACQDSLWLSARGIFEKYDGVAWKTPKIKNFSGKTFTVQTCTSKDELWISSIDGLAVRIAQDKAAVYGPAQGLSLGPIKEIISGQRVMVAGERGLALLVGDKFVTLRTETPAFEGITGVIEANNGDVWVNAAQGLSRITAAAIKLALLSANHEVAAELFDDTDGYPAPAYSQIAFPLSPIVQTDDGRIWMAGHGGIAWLAPAMVSHGVSPTPLVIQSVRADGVDYEHKPDPEPVQLPAGTHNLEIGYTALDYSHPERLRFRYRLEGQGESWVTVGSRRKAFYTDLKSGYYHFLVNVTDERGVWSNSVIALNIVVPPTFFESKGFVALCIFIVMGLLVLFYHLRIEQLEARQRRLLKATLDERTRISRELHDTLLQGTQALILRVHVAAREIPESNTSRSKIAEALRSAENMLAEGRDRIQELRLPSGTLDLGQAFAILGTELTEDSETETRILEEGRPRLLRPAVVEVAYLIGREALTNSVRHADARLIEVQLIYTDEEFRLRLRDDGVGMDPTILKIRSIPGHWGLTGMIERAKSVGGRVRIWTRAGSGVEVELIVPAAVAYGERSARPGWMRYLRTVLSGDT